MFAPVFLLTNPLLGPQFCFKQRTEQRILAFFPHNPLLRPQFCLKQRTKQRTLTSFIHNSQLVSHFWFKLGEYLGFKTKKCPKTDRLGHFSENQYCERGKRWGRTAQNKDLLFQRSLDQAHEQRVGLVRTRLELRVILHADKERVGRILNCFNKQPVG